MTMTMNYLFVHIFYNNEKAKKQLAIILCTAGCNNYELNYTASRLQELSLTCSVFAKIYRLNYPQPASI